MLRKYIYLLILSLCFSSISEASLHRSVSLEIRRTVQNMSYAYDLTGNPISKTDATGITITYAYDSLNRLTSVNFPDSTQNISYTYDATGKVLSMTDPSGTTTYSYDNSNRLLSDTKTIEGKTFNISYSYSLTGALTSITYPSGRIVGYERDVAGIIVKVTEEKDGKKKDIISSITYNTNGTVSNIVYGNGIQTIKGYDIKGMLNSLNIGTLKQLSYVRDNIGNITSIIDNLDPSKTKTYQYDALYRLTQAIGPWGTISYGYDGVGNRLTENSNAGVTNYSYTANKLMSSSGAKAFNFNYDNNGNTITENQKQYVYNQNQRLIKAMEDTKVLGEYLYNANGQRVKKVANGRTTYFIYDQSGNLIEEADEQGQVNIDYVYLGSVPIARVDEWWEGMKTPDAPIGANLIPGDKQLAVSWNANAEPVDGYKVYWGTSSGNYTSWIDVGKTTSYTITELTNGITYYVAIKAYANISRLLYYHTDHLGTPIILTDSNGGMVWSGELLPFGEQLSITGSVINNKRFPGQYDDKETGLYQNVNRDYHPGSGTYRQRDPIGLAGGINPYSYVDPINSSDPLGLCKWKGSVTMKLGGGKKGGAGAVVLMALKSECCNGKQAQGVYTSFCGGVSVSPKIYVPIQVSTSIYEFEGPATPSDSDPKGWFSYFAGALSPGGGISYGRLRTGSLVATGITVEAGIDIGLDSLIGFTIGSGETTCCNR